MTDQERTQLAKDLEKLAAPAFVNIKELLRTAAARIRDDGLRLKTQSQMAVTLNDTMEQALTALATFKKQCRCRS